MWLHDNDMGNIVFATLFSFLLLLPISLVRRVHVLHTAALASFWMNAFVMVVIFYLSFRPSASLSHHPEDRYQAVFSELKVSVPGIFNSLPLIVFSYMFQQIVP